MFDIGVLFDMDDLTKEQLQDINAAIVYYMNRNISVNNPRYNDYEVILRMLSKCIRNTHDRYH